MPAVEIDRLTVRYGPVTAVDEVTLHAEAGEVLALLGPNGAGKTTTVEILEGYRRADAGTVRVLGLDPWSEGDALRPRIGVMLQDGGVYPSARVLDTIRHYCVLHGRGADAGVLLEQVGLHEAQLIAQVLDALVVLGRRAAYHAPHLVPLREQQFRQV